jgi:hypothetical protein
MGLKSQRIMANFSVDCYFIMMFAYFINNVISVIYQYLVQKMHILLLITIKGR